MLLSNACKEPNISKRTTTPIAEGTHPSAKETPATGQLTETQGKILQNTRAMNYTGKSCTLKKDTTFYFSSYMDEALGTVEFSLTRPISGCDFTDYFFVDSNAVTIMEQKPDNWDNNIDLDEYIKQNYPDIASTIMVTTTSSENRTQPQKYFFPLAHRPLASYTSGGREFGARRVSGGRQHAAVDLLTNSNNKIYAVADGRVLDYYAFYQGTYALVVDHKDFVVRYGEISTYSKWNHIADNERHVSAGEVIAKAGTLYSGASMLHFEKYSGNKSGYLTVRSNYPFQRRSDLVNPTPFIQELEKKTFSQ